MSVFLPDDVFASYSGFLVQYEDSLHHKGVWVNLTEVDGTRTTTHLELSPYVYYSFRVLARNDVGYSEPSYPSSQYRTNPAGNESEFIKTTDMIKMLRDDFLFSSAPDENPSNVRGVGSQPDNMVISWMVR